MGSIDVFRGVHPMGIMKEKSSSLPFYGGNLPFSGETNLFVILGEANVYHFRGEEN